MKRILTSLILLTALIGSAYGRAVFFANTVVEFPVGTNPEQEGQHYVYKQDVLWTWYDGGEVINLSDAQDNDFYWSVETTGDMKIAEGYYDQKIGDNRYELKKGTGYGSNIHFTGNSGTLTVTALNPDFDGDPYQCTYTIIFHTNRKAKLWDFNSKQFTLNGSWDWSETHMSDNNTSPIYHKYNSEINGDGSDAVSEAAGLTFYAPNGCLGGNNPEGNVPVENRFVLFKPNYNGTNTSITIPISTLGYTNPRVRIKMAKFGDHITLGITNAKDALGTEITSDYKIGGSEWWGDKGDNNYRGEYHFIVNNSQQDMKIELKEGYLWLLSIEVYDSKEIVTENDVLANGYQLLNKEGAQSGIQGEYWLHYRGKGEGVNVNANTISTTGTVTCNLGNLTPNSNEYVTAYNYQSNVGEFGTFRFRIDCKDFNGNYCTDYAWRTHSVGYMQERSYPYTWDFTDIKPYATTDNNRIGYEATYTASGSTVYSNDPSYNPVSRKLWNSNSNNYELQLAADAGHDVHYCGGSQLWYGKTIIPETQYLAFTPVNYDAAYNGAMTITKDGLKFDQDLRSWWLWRITVPSVPSNGVIYVHAKKIKEGDFCNVGYYNKSDDAVTNKTEKSLFSTAELSNVETAREIADGNNVIYVIPASGVEGRDVTLFFTGVEVHKIAVSVDPKSLNPLGWATESRARVIDPELTAYMTGQPMESYIVTGSNVTNKTVTLETVYSIKDGGNEVMNIAAEGDNNAYIIHNKENVAVDMMKIGGGFHLFVPDMHDYGTVSGVTYSKSTKDMTNSILKSKLNSGKVNMYDDNYTNYVLTYQTAKAGWEAGDNIENIEDLDDLNYVGFFRVQPKGVTSAGHQGYMQFLTSDVKPANNTNSVGCFSLVFGEEETNAINNVEIEGLRINTGATYYNLQGQKLNGVPTKSGIYIVNGKKIAIK